MCLFTRNIFTPKRLLKRNTGGEYGLLPCWTDIDEGEVVGSHVASMSLGCPPGFRAV